MKIKNTHLAALACVSLIASAAMSQAAVIVTEDFNGTSTGFSNSWSGLTVSGGVATANSPSSRNLATAFPSTGTIWVSFDWGNSVSPTQGGSYGGLTFYIGGNEKFLIGNTWPDPAPHNVWQMNGAGGTTSVQNFSGMKTGVARITLGVGATSTVDLWVAATGSPVDVSGAPLASVTGRELAGADSIRINGQDFGGGANVQSFDNLIIGTTMLDVDAIPEPSAALLGGLGLLALLRRRR